MALWAMLERQTNTNHEIPQNNASCAPIDDRRPSSDQESQSPEPSKKDELARCVGNALAALQTDLESGKSATLVSYLEFLGRFHSYSFQNAMLILLQRPDASHVAGFNAWKSLGRHVKKGEKGIGILAPVTSRRKPDSKSNDDSTVNSNSEDEERRAARVIGFRVVHVFDVSQTEGDPLPELDTIHGDPGDYLVRLQDAITTHGIELTYDTLPGGALGVSQGGAITISPDLTDAERFSVLVHEFAHELLHRSERRAETTKTVRETEAEAVAYAVSHAIGLHNHSRSSDYIQLYNGDTAILAESLHYIQRTAHHILDAIADGVARS